MSRKPSPQPLPVQQPNSFRLRQGPLALAFAYGRQELPLFVSPVLYSEAIALWLAPPQDHERFLVWSSVPRRAAYRREAYELEAVFHTSAFLRSGATLTQFRRALGLSHYGPELPEISPQERTSFLEQLHQTFQTFRERLQQSRRFRSPSLVLSPLLFSPSAFF